MQISTWRGRLWRAAIDPFPLPLQSHTTVWDPDASLTFHCATQMLWYLDPCIFFVCLPIDYPTYLPLACVLTIIWNRICICLIICVWNPGRLGNRAAFRVLRVELLDALNAVLSSGVNAIRYAVFVVFVCHDINLITGKKAYTPLWFHTFARMSCSKALRYSWSLSRPWSRSPLQK